MFTKNWLVYFGCSTKTNGSLATDGIGEWWFTHAV